MRVPSVLIATGLLVSAASGASAQVSSLGASVPAEQMRARYQIATMEAVLERAVQLGARRLSQQVQAVSPDMLFIAGSARAKGFWLDSYGVFFDVDVPAMRRSVAWSFRNLDRDRGSEAAMQTLRRNLATVHDPQVRREMELALAQLSRAVGPPTLPTAPDGSGPQPGVIPASSGGPVRASNTDAGAPAPAPPAPPVPVVDAATAAVLDDPGTAYTNQVKGALVDAMLEFGPTIPIADGEWLTIAARDNEDSRLGGSDPYDVSTIVLRIRGADLSQFRAGRLSKEETLKRVEIREVPDAVLARRRVVPRRPGTIGRLRCPSAVEYAACAPVPCSSPSRFSCCPPAARRPISRPPAASLQRSAAGSTPA